MKDEAFPKIETLVRHRAPMLLLDSVEDDCETTTTCALTIREDSTFVEQGAVPGYVALEYMAQCVATHAGLRGARHGRPARIGYLIGARDVELLVDEFRVGERLRVTATHVWGEADLGQFSVLVESNGSAAARAQLSVYQGDLGGESSDDVGAT